MLMLKKGTEIIASSIAVFDKVVKQLEKGITLCQKESDKHDIEIDKNREKIAEFEGKKEALSVSITKARKVISNVSKLIE